ncbi:MAG: hypothetical protein WKF70_00670 [Chitinophagaceae bacterium]
MKQMFLALISAALMLTSCNDYGETITINEKSEVFYKGDGVGEADARNLGDFLLKQGYFTPTDERSVQLTKDGATYVVKFILDEDKIKAQDSATMVTGFKVWHMWIQDNVFDGAKTRLVLADAKLKDLREIGEFTAQEKAELNSESDATSTSSAQLSSDSANLNTSAGADAQTDSTNQ